MPRTNAPPWQPRWSSLIVGAVLARHWLPLGPEKGDFVNFIFVGLLVGGVLAFFLVFLRFYAPILRWCLDHKAAFLALPAVLMFSGLLIWFGFESFFGWVPAPIKRLPVISSVAHAFPGLGKEFMPPLDEGSFLYMPTTMPHASIGEVLDVLQKQDMAFQTLPEVYSTVGKLGRAETSLDPAPVSMIETVINYYPEYLLDESGRKMTFSYDPDENDLVRNLSGKPVPAPDGKPYYVAGAL